MVSVLRHIQKRAQPEKYGQQCECITVVLEAFDCICYGKKGGRNNCHLQNMDEDADILRLRKLYMGCATFLLGVYKSGGLGGIAPSICKP